jgi:uncharacterized protein YybS (DUF2232 family)
VPQIAPADKIKDVVFGTAITISLFVITLQSPFFGFVCTVCIPLPTLFYRIKLGRKTGILVPAVALGSLMLLLGGVSVDGLYFFELVLTGFVLGELFERNLSVEKTLILTSAAVIVAGLGVLLVFSRAAGTDVGTLVAGYIKINLESTVALYESMGVSEENIRLITDSADRIVYVLVRIAPAMAAAFALFVAWASLLLARPLFKRRNLIYPAFGKLNRWRAPDALVWPVIGCGAMLLIPDGGVKLVGVNGLMILMTVYFFQGIAIVSYYFDKKRFPRVLRVFLYALIALQQMVLLAVIGLGFFDVWVNFRKLGVVNNEGDTDGNN